jgi:hypothetical protein
MISGYIDYDERDIELIRKIFGDSITEIRKADFPGCYVARFENVPEEILDELVPHWGLFEWVVDE